MWVREPSGVPPFRAPKMMKRRAICPTLELGVSGWPAPFQKHASTIIVRQNRKTLGAFSRNRLRRTPSPGSQNGQNLWPALQLSLQSNLCIPTPRKQNLRPSVPRSSAHFP